ncbi:oxepin-CoA hydrolase, alternative type [uncultured Paracoccus sp.]|uniref:oxepin-CoA hydrolase, alternative type n=1 Tax=uncultured Paracoccus sp. TaxID=189685 RepID=UPI00260C5CD6|nr:enoyl-CoA hydratase family protein [uncultured Paracoccus sp.]
MSTHCEIQDKGDRLVVINRNAARRNALSPDFTAGLRSALAQATAAPRIASVIVTGEGGFFCAGGDLTVLQNAGQMTEAQRRGRIADLAQLMREVMGCARPVIAAVDGGAAGAGFSLAFACDLIVAARDAKFTAAYVNAGLVPDGGLTGSLMAALPPALASEIALTGRPVGAERLHALGAINELTEPGQALEAANALADRLAQGPAEAQASIKKLMVGARAQLMEQQFEAETPHMARALAGSEAAEGMAAFLTKRPAEYARLRLAAGGGAAPSETAN